MALLLLITFFCALLLALTGSLPFWFSGLIAAASLAGLALLFRTNQMQRRQLNRQRQNLQAIWGIQVRHLGGMPLPLDTPGNLFLLQDQLVLETEHDRLTLPLADLQQIFLTTSEQIRRFSDQQICSLMATGSCRTFSSLREKIRRHDSTLRKNGILMMGCRQDDEVNLIILATRIKPAILMDLLRQPQFDGKARTSLQLGQNRPPVI